MQNKSGVFKNMAGQPKSYKENFAGFFEEPTRDKLRELLKGHQGEFDNCDFKGEWIEPPKLARHILAMANSGGGCIIVGVAENNDKTYDPKGLSDLKDKKVIREQIENYIPSPLIDSFEILDFSYDASEYPRLVGRKYQVVLVEDDPEHIPFVSKKDGAGIQKNIIYVRHNSGPESKSASYEELQRILDRRLETGFSSGKEIDFRIHLEQLKILYKQLDKKFIATAWSSMMVDIQKSIFQSVPNPNYLAEDYEVFIIKMIDKKKKRIEIELDTTGL
jgi:hypothetical protein